MIRKAYIRIGNGAPLFQTVGETGVKVVLTHMAGGKLGLREVFPAGSISLGRDTSNNLVFNSAETKVSARHAEITYRDSAFRIRDIRSTNGTYINGQQVTESEL